MAGAFTAVDLSKLPFPAAVEPLDYETILSEMVADLQARAVADGLPFTAIVESDPAFKVLEVAAYREFLLRQRVNEAIKAVTLAYASGADLEQIAARYNVERLTITPADDNTIPPTPAVMEEDDSLRRRVQLAFEGFSTAGPEGAYIFHALGADAQVLDASVNSPRFSMAAVAPEVMALLPADSIVLQVDFDAGLADPMPGDVVVTVQSRIGDGTASGALLDAVEATLNSEEVRPLTDRVTVQSADIISYTVTAALTLYPGPDAAVVLAAAQAAVSLYVANQHRLGRDVTLSGLYAALHQGGVQNVSLTAPAANIVVGWNQSAYCTGITLTVAGTDE